jgi:uncharacterized protein (DUF1499 family)
MSVRGIRFARAVMMLVAVGLLVVVAGRIVSASIDVPTDVGLNPQGVLNDCGARTNCVASGTGSGFSGESALTFSDDQNLAKARLIALIRADGGEIRIEMDNYVGAVYRSTVFAFPDDVEFQFDEVGKTISWRSASRLGQGDMGVNADRMKRITSKWKTS